MKASTCMGNFVFQPLCRLLNSMMKTENSGEQGDIQKCNNYSGIKLLSHTWKTVVDKRLTECTSTRESQLRLMPGRSTTDAIYGLRQQLKSTERGQKDINLVFINLEKAYDHICREEVW